MRRSQKLHRYALLALAALIGMGILGSLERILLYHPYRKIEQTPKTYGVDYEDVHFRASDGVRLHGWRVPPKEADGPVLLWAHGNAGNLSHRAENIARIQEELGAGVFIFDYRGFGKSEGRPSEEGLYADGRAAYDWLSERAAPEHVFLFGRSIGAAVAVKLAAEGRRTRGLILESPFENTVVMGKKMFPFLPVGWLFSPKFDASSMIPKVEVPVLILHGDRDYIVPHAQGMRLYEAARARHKRFFTIKGAGHNDTYLEGGAPYWRAWRDFLKNPEAE